MVGHPTAGCIRHVYGVTEQGHQALTEWIEVIDEERQGLERMVRRFDKLSD